MAMLLIISQIRSDSGIKHHAHHYKREGNGTICTDKRRENPIKGSFTSFSSCPFPISFSVIPQEENKRIFIFYQGRRPISHHKTQKNEDCLSCLIKTPPLAILFPLWLWSFALFKFNMFSTTNPSWIILTFHTLCLHYLFLPAWFLYTACMQMHCLIGINGDSIFFY